MKKSVVVVDAHIDPKPPRKSLLLEEKGDRVSGG